MLKRWLEYAATGVLDSGETTARDHDSDFEEYVAQQIQAMGCEPVHQVGVTGYFIDIGVKHPDWPHGFLLGVECDGATYHSSKSARDRDLLRQQVLEGLGWHFHRVWSTDWFNDPRAEAVKLRMRIEGRLREAKEKGPMTVVVAVDEGPTAEHRPTSDFAGPNGEEAGKDDDLFAHAELRRSLQEKRNTQLTRRGPSNGEIDVGDTVRVRYLAGDQATLIVTLSDKKNDPDHGIVDVRHPLGEALIGAEAGDEVEVLIGSRVRMARIDEVHKANSADRAPAPVSEMRS